MTEEVLDLSIARPIFVDLESAKGATLEAEFYRCIRARFLITAKLGDEIKTFIDIYSKYDEID